MSITPKVGDHVTLAGPDGQAFINFEVTDRGAGVGIVRTLNQGFVSLAELAREGWKITTHRPSEPIRSTSTERES